MGVQVYDPKMTVSEPEATIMVTRRLILTTSLESVLYTFQEFANPNDSRYR